MVGTSSLGAHTHYFSSPHTPSFIFSLSLSHSLSLWWFPIGVDGSNIQTHSGIKKSRLLLVCSMIFYLLSTKGGPISRSLRTTPNQARTLTHASTRLARENERSCFCWTETRGKNLLLFYHFCRRLRIFSPLSRVGHLRKVQWLLFKRQQEELQLIMHQLIWRFCIVLKDVLDLKMLGRVEIKIISGEQWAVK